MTLGGIRRTIFGWFGGGGSKHSRSWGGGGPGSPPPGEKTNSGALLKSVGADVHPEPLEKLQSGFNSLIEQLQAINQGLSRHASQNEQLVNSLSELPGLLKDIPGSVRQHEQFSREMLEQLKANATGFSLLCEIMEKVPVEVGRQSETLAGIGERLEAGAETNAKMAGNFERFHETLGKLNDSSTSQTDSIMQMSRTFATSDRYLKYIVSRQNKRFMWLLVGTVAVCLVVILVFAGIIIHLNG